MSRITIHPGVRYEHNGRPFEIKKVHKQEAKIEVLDLSTGMTTTIDQDVIARGLYQENTLRFEVSGKNRKPVSNGWFSTAYQLADFENAGKHQREAWDRYRIVRSVFENLREGKDWNTAYREGLKKAFADGVAKRTMPSMRTVQRWVSEFIKGGLDPRSLVPYARQTRRKSVFSKDVEEAMSLAITRKYLNMRRPHLEGAYLEVLNIIADRNRVTDGIVDGLRVPSRSTFWRRMRRIDPIEVAECRHGIKKGKEQYGGSTEGVETERINQRWEMDHTTLDLVLVDEEDGRPIGRPTLSFAIDCFSRSPMGFYLGFEPPSYQTVMACLRHAITPKYYLRSLYPFIRNEWGACGLPETVVLDRGPEFQNRSLDEACAELGIDIDDCPPREPHFKGIIERLFRTVNLALLSDIPGKTFSTIFEKEEYDPVKNAILPLRSFLKILHLFLVDYYLQRFHRGLKDVPAEKWREGFKEAPPAMPQSPDDLKKLLPSLRRTIQPQGIEILNIFYNHDERLPALRAKYNQGRKKEQVLVRYDKWDMGKIWVFDRFRGDIVEVPAVDRRGYTKYLSWYKHKIVLSRVADRKKKVDIDELARVSRRIEEIVRKDYLKNKRMGTRKKLARFLGKGAEPDFPDLDREGGPFADIVRGLTERVPETGYENCSDLRNGTSLPAWHFMPSQEQDTEQLATLAINESRQIRNKVDEDEVFDLRGWGASYDMKPKKRDDT